MLFQATPDWSIQLNGFAQSVRSNGALASYRDPVTHAPSEGPYDISHPSHEPSKVGLYLGSVVINGDLHWAKLTSVTGFQRATNTGDADFSVPYSAILGRVLGPAGVLPYITRQDVHTDRVTQELRLTSRSGQPFEWVVGGFYSHEKTFQDIAVLNTADPNGALSLPGLNISLPIGEFLLPSTSRDFALFGDGTFHFSPKLDATAGVRYSWNHQTFTSSGFGLIVNPAAPTQTISIANRSNENVATYLFNLRYRPVEGTMVYGRIANGYRPGGPNLVTGGTTSGNASFSADKLWNYEVGVRQSLGSSRSFINLSGYHIDWTNIQQVTNIDGVNQLTNAGDARINGVEATVSLRILPQLNFLLASAYTDAKLTTTAPLLGVAYKGAKLPLTPKFSITATATYSFHINDALAGDLNLTMRHIGERNAGYAGSAIAPLYKLASYNSVDLNIAFRTANGWDFGPYVTNIFDKRGEVSAITIANQYVPSTLVPVTLTRPRTVGMTLGRSF